MHIILISHKDVSNYIDGNLPKDKVDGWRGVSGRFKHVNLHNNYSQMYEIITAVIHKNPHLWPSFLSSNQKRFADLKDRFTKSGLLSGDVQDDLTAAIEGCYPLHPISTFILPRLSERVAQNERTLFTFLSADDKHTLSAFVQSAENDFALLTPDYIYDYFEPLFRKEPYTSDVHKMYKLTTSVLRRVEGKPLHAKIIKTIALIYLVEQFEKLPPIVDVVVDAFRDMVADTKEIDLALNELIENDCVVYLKRSNNYLKIKETSGVDIGDEIVRYKAKNYANITATTILNESAFDSFLYPTRYNDQYDIVRYFEFRFIDSAEFWAVDNWCLKIGSVKADGAIYAIVPESQGEIETLREAIVKNSNPLDRIVFILPRNYIDINKDVFDYATLTALKTKAIECEDEILTDEYELYVEDLSEVIGSFFANYARPENASATYYYMGTEHHLKRRAQLSGLLSDICESIFNRTPIINNEQINKNDLPANTINSRTKILAGLLLNELAPNIGLTGTGQDVSIMRSTLLQTGVLVNADTTPAIQLQPTDERMTDLLNEICSFFVNQAAQQGGVSFQLLYDTLTLHEYGFGMKRGVIPLYIAAVLHKYKNNLVILYRGSEVKITPELLNGINEKPQDFTVVLEDWNEDKARYLQRLEEVFAEFIAEREKSFNNFTYLFYAMNRWYLSLPKFAKETEYIYAASTEPQKIQVSHKKFVNSLKQLNTNPREFLFERVFTIFRYKDFTEGVIENILAVKMEYDNAVKNVVTYLIEKAKRIFAFGAPNGSLASIIKDWYEGLSDFTRQNLFRGNENKVLELMTSITNDNHVFMQRLAKAITFLRIEDWNSDTVDSFLNDLNTFKNTVEEFNASEVTGSKGVATYEITFIDEGGNTIPKRFQKTEYSDRAKLLLSEMAVTLDEYGQSITEQEKRQVLIELLEKLC